MGSDGFEPPKLEAADLQSAPFGHSGTTRQQMYPPFKESLLSDSNQRPRDYKSRARPTELKRHYFAAEGYLS